MLQKCLCSRKSRPEDQLVVLTPRLGTAALDVERKNPEGFFRNLELLRSKILGHTCGTIRGLPMCHRTLVENVLPWRKRLHQRNELQHHMALPGDAVR